MSSLTQTPQTDIVVNTDDIVIATEAMERKYEPEIKQTSKTKQALIYFLYFVMFPFVLLYQIFKYLDILRKSCITFSCEKCCSSPNECCEVTMDSIFACKCTWCTCYPLIVLSNAVSKYCCKCHDNNDKNKICCYTCECVIINKLLATRMCRCMKRMISEICNFFIGLFGMMIEMTKCIYRKIMLPTARCIKGLCIKKRASIIN